MAARTIAVCNQKGGVGKTNTTFHLARAAVLAGIRTLCVDLDPQGNLTTVTAGTAVADDQTALADALSERVDEPLGNVIVPGVWDGLDVAPTAGETLGTVRDELVIAGLGRELKLGAALSPVADDYGLLLIDCPPSLDQLTINGLAAADAALIVTQARLFSTNGLARLLATIDDVKRLFNPELATAGVVINQYENRTVAARHWRETLNQAADEYQLPILEPPVPKRTVIGDAPEAATGLDQWGSEASKLADIYTSYLTAIMNGATP